MKMMYNGTQIKSLNVKHFEMDTNDCDMIASDLQAGKTAVARGKKITGTGKSFEFANYGAAKTNVAMPIPANINVIEVASLTYPVQLAMALINMKNMDFTVGQIVGYALVNGTSYPLTAQITNNRLKISCSQTIALEVFYGKDNYT